MNILIDTNVLLSAALRDRLPERVVLFVATNSSLRWIVTPEIRDEYARVLERRKFGLSQDVLQHWRELIDMRTISVPAPQFDINFPRDPKDSLFLAAAIAAGADYLITGDKDLLEAKLSIRAQIVTASQLAAQFGIA
ncbi:MAG TPA: putative toxin-antitoxin system toxin component, PIN family [Lacipirellulaceae bacterium]|nr:putative toxin-antitoxin system toxin component, PIN family [Lacipirellulaceae bacterium]